MCVLDRDTVLSRRILALLRRFGSVTVLNGHIHQILHKVEGNVAFHSARSTAYPQPAPGAAPSPGPLKVPKEQLPSILGIRSAKFVPGHDSIALIDANMPVAVVCPRDNHYEKTLSNVQEVRAREGQVFAIATEGDDQVADLAQYLFLLPDVKAEVLPLLTVLPLQLLSYYAADLKGTDVDQPRNLAKTVTVE